MEHSISSSHCVESTAKLNYDATLAYLKKAVSDVGRGGLAPEEIKDDAHLYDDCGLDSISIVDFTIAAEQYTGIPLHEIEINVALLSNIGALARFISDMPANSGQGELTCCSPKP
jgi:acyl carrier protein